MEKRIKINSSPRRTSENFGMNDLVIEELDIKSENEKNKENKEFLKYKFKGNKVISLNKIERKEKEKINKTLKYGNGKELLNQNIKNTNFTYEIVIDGKSKISEYAILDLNIEETSLIDNLTIKTTENSVGYLVIRLNGKRLEKWYHNGVIKTEIAKYSKLKLVYINNLSTKTNNYISFENKVDEEGRLDNIFIDLGGNINSLNYYTSLDGYNSKNNIYSIYTGSGKQTFDYNYIVELFGKNASTNIDVRGVLNDEAKKSFKGTIDFKEGSTKSFGDESEYCILLSKKAKSKALPMLLCHEDDVVGNHSSATGKIDQKELFYIKSRGINEKDAQKLIVRAKLNKTIDKIEDKNIKQYIIEKLDI